MAQFYTLEEAANRLGIGPDEFKRRLKIEWTSIRPFRDGATLRFRAADIDELARSLGAASDPGLPLGPVGAPPAEEGSDEFAAPPPPPAPSAKGKNTRRPADEPLMLAPDDPSEEIALPTGDSSIHKRGNQPKPAGDSDVRLELAPDRSAPDSGSSLPTEEIALDLGGPGSAVIKPASSARLTAPKSGARLAGPESGRIPSPTSGPPAKDDSSSEFELSLDADSDSFELQMNTDSSDEVDLGSLDAPASNKEPQSGINLGKPSDSGVSLEKKGPKTGPVKGPQAPPDDSDVDFELSLDPAGASGVKLGGPRSSKNLSAPTGEDSSSEFELTLDDSSGVSESLANDLDAPDEAGKGDIFETDFELPAMDDESGSEVVSVDAADTDLEATGFEVDVNDLDAPADDDSASQVVLVDDAEPLIEDDADLVTADVDAGPPSARRALRGVRDVDDEPVAVRTVQVPAAPAKWGPLPAVVLLIALVPTFLGLLMSFEVVRGMWGYHQPARAGNPLIRGVASTFGYKVNDEAK